MQPYISDAMIQFLQGIHMQNETTWMHENKSLYTAAKSDFEAMVFCILQGIQQFDASIPPLEPKKCMYRINRDIRFTKDKRPYKEHFGAFISPNGKNWDGAGYYVHIEPAAESFIAAGNYKYNPELIQNFRKSIIVNPKKFIKIKDTIEASQKFSHLEGKRVKRVPSGFTGDHPQVELLKHKSYAFRHTLTSKELQSKQLVNHILALFEQLQPFVHYINGLR